MEVVYKKIKIAALQRMSERMFGRLVKAVVDVEKEIMVVDADLHSDAERLLLDQGSRQENLWGINLYPDQVGVAAWIEFDSMIFDSMINVRPSYGNKSRGVDKLAVCEKLQ